MKNDDEVLGVRSKFFSFSDLLSGLIDVLVREVCALHAREQL